MDHNISFKKENFLKRTHIIILLILNLLNIEVIQCTIFPTQQTKFAIPSQQYIGQRMIITDDYFVNIHFKTNFSIYNITTNELIISYLYQQTIYSLVQDFSIIDKQNLYFLTTDQRLITYNISLINKTISKSSNISLDYQFQNIYLTEKQILLYNMMNGQIHRYTRDNQILIQIIKFTKNFNYGIKVCQKNSTHYYIALWYSTCLIKIYKCQYNSNCSLIVNQDICNSINFINLKYEFDFSHDCGYFVQYWNLSIPRIINLNTLSINYYENNLTLISPLQIFFLDKSNLNFGQLDNNDGNLYIFHYYNGSYLNNTNSFKQMYYSSCYSYSKVYRKLFIQNTSQIKIYDLNCLTSLVFNQLTGTCQTTNCPLRCINCSYNDSLNNIGCSQCEIGYNINNLGGCTIKTQQINSTNRNKIQNFIQNMFQDTAATSISSTILFFQMLPVSFLFMRFINFWSICSFYLIVPFDMPNSLKKIIQSIAQIVNTSIFNFFDINLKFQINLQQKFSKIFNQKYGLTSDFINGNLQNFSILLFSYLIVFACYIIQKM